MDGNCLLVEAGRGWCSRGGCSFCEGVGKLAVKEAVDEEDLALGWEEKGEESEAY